MKPGVSLYDTMETQARTLLEANGLVDNLDEAMGSLDSMGVSRNFRPGFAPYVGSSYLGMGPDQMVSLAQSEPMRQMQLGYERVYQDVEGAGRSASRAVAPLSRSIKCWFKS